MSAKAPSARGGGGFLLACQCAPRDGRICALQTAMEHGKRAIIGGGTPLTMTRNGHAGGRNGKSTAAPTTTHANRHNGTAANTSTTTAAAATAVMGTVMSTVMGVGGKRDINSNTNGVVRRIKTVEVRKEEVLAMRNRFPTKIPVIVQRFCKETNLPQMDKSKFLVPQELTMSQFLTVIRNRMRVTSTQAMYLLVNNRSMISPSVTMAEVYSEHSGADGYLYVTYASQEVFGAHACAPDDERLGGDALAHNDGDENDELWGIFNRDEVPRSIQKAKFLNCNESHFIACFDNTYKSMMVG